MRVGIRAFLKPLAMAPALPLALALTTALAATTGARAASHDPLAPTGNAEAGKTTFRQCIACHVVVDPSGAKLAGRNGKTGPNLYGVAGRTAGSLAGYKYGKSMKEASSASGDRPALVWTQANFATYVQDPTGFLRELLGDKRARAKMTFKVRAAADAANLYAYLYSLAPPPAATN